MKGKGRRFWKNHGWRVLLLAFASAVLLRLAFPKYALFPLAYVALVPLFLALFSLERPLDGLFAGIVFGVIFHYSNIFWLNTVAAYNPFALVGIFLLGIYLGLFPGIFGWASIVILKRSPRLSVLLLPSLWVILEYLRSIGQLAFPWSFVSASQAPFPEIIQIAELTGTWGISFLIVLVNFVLALFLSDLIRRERLKPHIPRLFFALGLFLLVLFFGMVRMKYGSFNGPKEIRVAICQPNIPQKLKFASYAGSAQERQHLPSVLRAINFSLLDELEDHSVDLAILPESAFTSPYFGYQSALLGNLSSEARRLSAAILVGANREIFFDKQGKRTTKREEISNVGVYNSAWYFPPDGSPDISCYDKIQLVPFGEHLPYFDLIPGFQRIIVQTGSFLKGDRYTLFPVYFLAGEKKTTPTLQGIEPAFHFGTVICFESGFGRLFRRYARKGADFFVIITNDGWYEESAGPFQHNQLAVFRAVETRRWVLRCSNRGISGAINPRGEFVKQTPLNEKALLHASIFPAENRTGYRIWGNLFIWLLIFFCLGEWLLHFKAGRKKKK